AAMAHLHLVSIHPYRDGNGRAARVLQSLVLVREGILTPEFASIEVYLGAHTEGYYQALRVQGAEYDPSREAGPWLDFCLEAHRQEDMRLREQLQLAYARNTLSEQICADHGYPERVVTVLDIALTGLEMRNETYRTGAGVAIATATQDLARLVRDGWLVSQGGGRSARYTASERLQSYWSSRQKELLRRHDPLSQTTEQMYDQKHEPKGSN
ncbi:MAG: Fic family protein, partial [Candidatus Dormibacteraceae bacterium]